MKIADRLEVPMAPDALWALIEGHFARLAQCLPGLKRFVPLGEDRYQVAIVLKVGPLSMNFSGELARAASDAAARRLRLVSDTSDPKMGSSVSLGLDIALGPGPAGSVIDLDADVEVRGKLASLGWGMIQPKSRALIKEFGQNLQALVAAGDL